MNILKARIPPIVTVNALFACVSVPAIIWSAALFVDTFGGPFQGFAIVPLILAAPAFIVHAVSLLAVLGLIREGKPVAAPVPCKHCGFILYDDLESGCPECGWNRQGLPELLVRSARRGGVRMSGVRLGEGVLPELPRAAPRRFAPALRRMRLDSSD